MTTPRVTVPLTNGMISAADAYIRSIAFNGQYNLPAMFRWHDMWAAMLSAAPAPEGGAVRDVQGLFRPDAMGGRRWRHKVRGTTYTSLGFGKAQCSPSGLLDDESVVIYRGDDGSLWARRHAEFSDGRFEELPALASGSGDHAELARLAEAASGSDWQTYISGRPEYKNVTHYVEQNPPRDLPFIAEVQEERDAAFIAAANPATILALLAENAALREQVKFEKQVAYDENDRWQEAERKLAEAVGLLEPFAKLADEEGGYREDDRLAWGLNTADINWGDLRAARTFLSKEAERG